MALATTEAVRPEVNVAAVSSTLTTLTVTAFSALLTPSDATTVNRYDAFVS